MTSGRGHELYEIIPCVREIQYACSETKHSSFIIYHDVFPSEAPVAHSAEILICMRKGILHISLSHLMWFFAPIFIAPDGEGILLEMIGKWSLL